MVSTEQIIYEAKEAGKRKSRQEWDSDSRRPSIVVDDSGMIIQRGFLIPSSRSSSQNSLARSATNSSANSSFNAEFCTPGTPSDSPRPGYARPTGSLYHAPEFRRLRNESATSLLLPTEAPPPEVAWNLRPGLERRQTWQQHGRCLSQASSLSSHIDDEELELLDLKTKAKVVPRAPPPAEPMPGVSASLLSQHLLELRRKNKGTMAKRQSVPEVQAKQKTILQRKCDQRSAPESSTGQLPKQDESEQPQSQPEQRGKESKVELAEGSKEAIESDSEDDYMEESDVTIQRSRNGYAARRAQNDAK